MDDFVPLVVVSESQRGAHLESRSHLIKDG